MAPQSDIALTQLGIPQHLTQLFRDFNVLTKQQQSQVLALMEEHRKSLTSGRGTEACTKSQTMIRSLQSLFAPVRHLPSEILVEIFRLYLAPDFTPQRVSPIILASVCAFWRTAVLSSPILWSRVKISAQGDFYSPPKVEDRDAERARFWMDRIGNHQPWSLSIDLERVASPLSSQPQPRRRVTPLSSLLGHQAVPQLQELRIDSEEPITGVESFTFPALRSLLVRWRQPNHHIQTLDTPFPTVPNLTKLAIVNAITVNSNTSTTKLPWSRITHLFIEGITMQKWRMVIGQCVELREGCFSVEEPSQHIAEMMSDDVHITPTVLRHLRKLTFLNKPPFHRDFQQLSFPALEDLNVVFGPEDGSGLQGGWRQETLASFHDVKRIMVAGRQTRVAPESLESTVSLLLDAAPLVEHLDVDVECDVGALVRLLTSDPSRLRLGQLRRLEIALNLERLDHKSFPLAAVAALFKSRASQQGSAAKAGGQHFILRLLKTSGSKDIRRSLEDMSREVKGARIDVVEDFDPIGVVPPSDPQSGDYKHWNDGLMDFLVRN